MGSNCNALGLVTSRMTWKEKKVDNCQYVVTGASKGIGKFLLQEYVSDGIDVIGCYNSTPPDTSLSRYYSKVDVRQEDQIKDFVQQNAGRLQRIVLINCAGVNVNAVVHKMDLEKWEAVLDVNLGGAFLMAKNLLPIMRAENFGRIINISSVVSELGIPGTAAYASSKAALWGLTKVIAKENASKGVTCNCLNLGYFDIGMISEVPEKVLNEIVQSIPQRQLGHPNNIYNAVEFLVKSDYVTGTAIDINGGLY